MLTVIIYYVWLDGLPTSKLTHYTYTSIHNSSYYFKVTEPDICQKWGSKKETRKMMKLEIKGQELIFQKHSRHI